MIDARTDTHTDRQTQATTIPEGQNWPRVKTYIVYSLSNERNCHKATKRSIISSDINANDINKKVDKYAIYGLLVPFVIFDTKE